MEALGLDWKLLVAQMVNFGLLFFVLKKVLYKPLIKAILQLPEEVIIDLHFGNWGVDENGSLKIIDYAGV